MKCDNYKTYSILVNATQNMLSLIILCTQPMYLIDLFLGISVYSNSILIHLHYSDDDKLRHANDAYVSCDHRSDLWAPPPISPKRICFSWKWINFSPRSLKDPINCFLLAMQHEQWQTKIHSSSLKLTPNTEAKCFIRSTSRSDSRLTLIYSSASQ